MIVRAITSPLPSTPSTGRDTSDRPWMRLSESTSNVPLSPTSILCEVLRHPPKSQTSVFVVRHSLQRDPSESLLLILISSSSFTALSTPYLLRLSALSSLLPRTRAPSTRPSKHNGAEAEKRHPSPLHHRTRLSKRPTSGGKTNNSDNRQQQSQRPGPSKVHSIFLSLPSERETR